MEVFRVRSTGLRFSLAALLAAGTAALPGRVSAATYIVDQANPQAKDENPGTAELPFKTIAKGTHSLQPGDEVQIKAGTYRESVTVQASGTAEKPITIAAFAGDEGKVIITGSDLITNWQKTTEAVWTTPWNNTFESKYPESWIAKFGFADYGPYAKRCEMVFVGGKPLTQVLGTALLRRGTFVVDETRHLLRVALIDRSPLADAEVSVRQQGFTAHGSFLHVKRISVIHVANPYEVAALGVYGDDNVIENCRAEYNNLDGLRASGHRLHITSNVADHNGDCGMVMAIQDSRLENNQTNSNSWRMGPGWHEGGVKLIGGRPAGNLITGHLSKDNRGPGLWFDTCGGNNRVENCRLEGNLVAGIEFEADIEGNSATNNIICGTRVIPDVLYPKGDGAGILLYETGGVKIQNNTIVGNGYSGIAMAGGVRNGSNTCANNEISHNIIANNGTTGLVFWVWGKAAESTTLASHRSDNNVWYEPQAKTAIFPAGELDTLSQLQAMYGQDTHSLCVDPMFVAADKGDYHLHPEVRRWDMVRSRLIDLFN